MAREEYKLETASLEIYEIVRRAIEETQIEKGNKDAQKFDAVYLDPRQISDVTRVLRGGAREAVNVGLTVSNAAKLEGLAQTIDDAAKAGDGSAIIYLFDDAFEHEEWHKAGYEQAPSEKLSMRHSPESMKALATSDVVKKLRKGAFQKLYPKSSDVTEFFIVPLNAPAPKPSPMCL